MNLQNDTSVVYNHAKRVHDISCNAIILLSSGYVCVCEQEKFKEEQESRTQDGTHDWHGRPAIREKSGGWVAGIIILRMLHII